MGLFSNLASYPKRLNELFAACVKIYLLRDEAPTAIGAIAAGCIVTAGRDQAASMADYLIETRDLLQENVFDSDPIIKERITERFLELSSFFVNAKETGMRKFRKDIGPELERIVRTADIDAIKNLVEDTDKFKELYFNE